MAGAVEAQDKKDRRCKGDLFKLNRSSKWDGCFFTLEVRSRGGLRRGGVRRREAA